MSGDRIGKFKIRFPAGYVDTRVVWLDPSGTPYVFAGYQRRVKRIHPPEDYKGRRSEGLVEWEVVS